MGFLRFACFLLVVLPLTSLSIIKFHRDKDATQEQVDSFASTENELILSNNIGGRRLGVKELMQMEISSKSFETFSSSSSNGGEDGKKKIKKKIIPSLLQGKRKLIGSGSAVYNADYLTHMHHPPKHN